MSSEDAGEWLVLDVRLPPGDAEEGSEPGAAVSRALLELGGSSVREEGRSLRTWVPVPGELEAFLRRVRRRLAEVDARGELQLRWRRAPGRDWTELWKRGLGPRRVGRRMVVAPGWSEVEPGEGEVVVRVDPGMAFGTGEHGTTRGALRLLEDVVEPGDRVLDVGTGSGVLALAAARLGAEALGVESDGDAVRTARENVRRNGLEGRVEILELEATPALLRLLAPPEYELVVANILAPALTRLLPGLGAVVRPGGRMILGGVLEEERGEMEGAARRHGWVPEAEDRDDGWWTARYRRTS